MSTEDPVLPGTVPPAADPARAAQRLRARQAVAVADLFLPAEGRLRDDDRATIARLLAELVARTETALRTHLAVAFAGHRALAGTLDASGPAIAAPILERAGTLRDTELIATLARRAAEGRLIARLRIARDRSRLFDGDPATQAGYAEDPDPAITGAARRLAMMAARCRDARGAPILAPSELAAEVQHRFVWRVAAALRDHVVARLAVPAARVDPPIAHAVAMLLAGYDEAETPPAHAMALARALHDGGRLDDGAISAAVADAVPDLATAMLAVRAGIGFGIAWDMLVDPARLLLLCRAAGLERPVAADIAVRLADDGEDDALADRLEAYGHTPPHQAIAALMLWRLDPAYRDSIAELADGAAR